MAKRRHAWIAATVWFVVQISSLDCPGQNGQLDPDFGDAGSVFWPNVVPSGSISGIHVLPNNDLLIGTSGALHRLLSDGTSDPTFGEAGWINCPMAVALVTTPNGGIISVGGHNHSFLRRFLANGEVDPSFGTNGQTPLLVGYLGFTHCAAVGSDGSIMIGQSGEQYYIMLRKFETDGDPDLSFGTDGVLLPGLSASSSFPISIDIDPQDRVLVAGSAMEGSSETGAVLCRFMPDGTPDPTFGTNGRISVTLDGNIPYGQHALVLQNGDIVIAGRLGLLPTARPWMARFDSDGALMASFGTNGVVVGPPFPGTTDIKNLYCSATGDLFISGTLSSLSGHDMWVARWNASGVLDTSFGEQGVFMYPAPCNHAITKTGAMTPDGDLLVGGSVNCGDTAGVLFKLRCSTPTSTPGLASRPDPINPIQFEDGVWTVQVAAGRTLLRVDILNSVGALLHTLPTNASGPLKQRIPLPADLAPGVHFLRIVHSQGQHMHRFVRP